MDIFKKDYNLNNKNNQIILKYSSISLHNLIFEKYYQRILEIYIDNNKDNLKNIIIDTTTIHKNNYSLYINNIIELILNTNKSIYDLQKNIIELELFITKLYKNYEDNVIIKIINNYISNYDYTKFTSILLLFKDYNDLKMLINIKDFKLFKIIYKN